MAEYICTEHTADQCPASRERIVRCKDCKHGGFNDDMHNGFCDAFSGHILWVEPDGFCSWGEPKGEPVQKAHKSQRDSFHELIGWD